MKIRADSQMTPGRGCQPEVIHNALIVLIKRVKWAECFSKKSPIIFERFVCDRVYPHVVSFVVLKVCLVLGH
jgi:hypothetical protein